MFKFNPDKVIGTEIGHGTFSTVYPYRKSPQDKRWVVKSLYAKNTEELEAFLQPIVLGANHNHPNVLPVMGYHIGKEMGAKKLFIKLPRMKESLKDKIEKFLALNQGSMPIEEVVGPFYDAVRGLEYLESRRIAHQDLKPSNILLDNKGRAKVSDIGMVRGGSYSYVAPEIISQSRVFKKRDLHKGDIWSLGIVIVELCLLRNEPVVKSLNKNEIKSHIEGCLLEVKERYGQDLVDILGQMLNVDPEARLSLKEIRQRLENKFEGIEREQIEEEQPIEQRMEEEFEEEEEEIMGSPFYDEGRQEIGDEEVWPKESIDEIKKRLEEKWKEFFLFDQSEPWTINVQDETKLTDIEVDIFLFDIAENLKEKHTRTIQKAKLNFKDCTNITDTGLGHIGSHIAQYFANVRELTLGFSGWDQVTDKGLTQLIDHITTNVTKLERLTLDFSYWIKISDQGLAHVGTQISQNLSNLKELKILLDYTNISDAGIAALVGQISQRISNLRTLQIGLGGCFNISDQGLANISNSISQSLIDLQKLILNLSFCTTITDKGLIEFAQYVPKHLKQLKQLSIDFGGCVEITDKGLLELSTNIARHLKGLESLNLDFGGCTQVVDKHKELLKKTLSFIPKVTIN